MERIDESVRDRQAYPAWTRGSGAATAHPIDRAHRRPSCFMSQRRNELGILHQLCEARVPLENLPELPFAALRRGGLHKADAGNPVVEPKHP